MDDPSQQLIELVRQGRSFSGRERNCMFLNTRDGRFANVSAVSGIDYADDARAIGRVDWDADGRIDLWISNRNAPQVRFLRNQLPTPNGFISFKLQGTRSNRDAIGARVIVNLPAQPDQPLTLSARAGDGYLSQSSKWLHFGVGQAEQCDVRVEWPSGERSDFTGLTTRQRYRLIEGDAEAERITPPRDKVSWRPQPLSLPPATDQLAVFSMVRPVLPRLEYLSDESVQRDLIQLKGKPTLVVLWASWCQPCMAELAEISQQQAQLRAAGLNVVAISVDRLATGTRPDDSDTAAVMQRFDFPFTRGAATEPLMEKLQLVNDFMFGLKKPFPVPTSFLIDKDYRLAAIYRGRLDLNQLLDDVNHLEISHEQRRERSVPFRGRWASEPTSLPMSAEVMELIRAGFAEDASELVQRTQGMYDRKTILQLVVRLGMAHYRAGEKGVANQHFEMARKVQPNTVGPEIELGQWHESIGEYGQAIRFYRAALRKSPRSLPALNNLAWLQATCPDRSKRNAEQAVKLASAAVQLSGGNRPELLDTLATSLAEAGRRDEAVQVAERGIAIALKMSRFNLAGEMRRRKDGF